MRLLRLPTRTRDAKAERHIDSGAQAKLEKLRTAQGNRPVEPSDGHSCTVAIHSRPSIVRFLLGFCVDVGTNTECLSARAVPYTSVGGELRRADSGVSTGLLKRSPGAQLSTGLIRPQREEKSVRELARGNRPSASGYARTPAGASNLFFLRMPLALSRRRYILHIAIVGRILPR